MAGWDFLTFTYFGYHTLQLSEKKIRQEITHFGLVLRQLPKRSIDTHGYLLAEKMPKR